MLGLINRSIQNFLTDTHGVEVWRRVAARLGLSAAGFEPMLKYEKGQSLKLIEAACAELGRSRTDLLEDLGTYLATREPVRRLLRYGGCDYTDFLNTLDDLHDRARMALADLDLPELSLETLDDGEYRLRVAGRLPGWATVFSGILRAMADDYGVLALIESEENGEIVSIRLLDSSYAKGRNFALSRPLEGNL
ncbi:MAG: heme NO-binding domain-containing protein [Thioclava sp.]|nr:heme NO-binding domain-containing protein [Thioclava sp.]MBD3804612.1 heme NO-binding domain-containing protein [Thioclava sp.]